MNKPPSAKKLIWHGSWFELGIIDDKFFVATTKKREGGHLSHPPLCAHKHWLPFS